MTGALVVAVVLVLVLAVGLVRHSIDGRARAQRGGPALEASLLGSPLGERATLVQFSSAQCAPCRTTRIVLADVASSGPGLVHVELDAASRSDLTGQFGVLRTPTTLLLDARGVVRQRISGAAGRREVLSALDAMAA